jgi:hypothetical protein
MRAPGNRSPLLDYFQEKWEPVFRFENETANDSAGRQNPGTSIHAELLVKLYCLQHFRSGDENRASA